MNLPKSMTYALSLLVAVCVLAGCREEKPERKYKQLEGLVDSVNPETGEVAMLWYNEKKGRNIRVEGTVTKDTEILINGRVARLEDIRPKERVCVLGYIEGEGLDRHIVATRIEITREEKGWTPASAPAGTTQPSGT